MSRWLLPRITEMWSRSRTSHFGDVYGNVLEKQSTGAKPRNWDTTTNWWKRAKQQASWEFQDKCVLLPLPWQVPLCGLWDDCFLHEWLWSGASEEMLQLWGTLGKNWKARKKWSWTWFFSTQRTLCSSNQDFSIRWLSPSYRRCNQPILKCCNWCLQNQIGPRYPLWGALWEVEGFTSWQEELRWRLVPFPSLALF